MNQRSPRVTRKKVHARSRIKRRNKKTGEKINKRIAKDIHFLGILTRSLPLSSRQIV
jgi:hypoxanthine-guanine phosphoribosyltransferase